MSFISDGYERCEIIAMYIIDNGCTVRAAANRFGISKSTVHTAVIIKSGSCGASHEP